MPIREHSHTGNQAFNGDGTTERRSELPYNARHEHRCRSQGRVATPRPSRGSRCLETRRCREVAETTL